MTGERTREEQCLGWYKSLRQETCLSGGEDFSLLDAMDRGATRQLLLIAIGQKHSLWESVNLDAEGKHLKLR